jgi:two-component system sensor histidine kinase BaeS
VRRSLLSRLLGLSLGVAALAVSATALLATYGTGNQFRDALAGEESLLAIDSDILAALYTYANEHPSWDGIEPLVRDLADRTGRRIALAAPDGELIADSAQSEVGLPPVPAARIDATSRPADDITGDITGDIAVQPNVVVQDPAHDGAFSVYAWQLTEDEQRQRQALADQAADCLRSTSTEATATRTGAPTKSRHHHAGRPDGPVAPTVNPCLPAALFEPSAASRALHDQVVARTTACLDEHQLVYEVTANPHGLPVVQSPPETPKSPEWTQCVETALADAKRPYVAAPADLYLGESDRFDPFSPNGWWRTATTVAAVLLAAAAVTILAGRRLVRPIRTLTAAAQRMAAGDRATRVPVRGNDEVTRLAAAFNTMTDSVASTERQHKTLVSDIAHEVRTPLANVRSHLEAAQDGVLPLDPALVGSLIEESALLERLVTDLQDLALADAGMLRIHPEERDAADLAEQAVAAHRAHAEASEVDLRLVTEPVDQPVVVHADPFRLRQALGNIVSNAIRHTPAGGSVTVTVHGPPDDSGHTVTFTVTDTGSGIAPEHLPHIFDRLYRADPSRSRTTGGNGLGLAITKHLVEAHHGHLEVTSTPGTGSTFTIQLPTSQAQQPSSLERYRQETLALDK